MRIHAWAGVEVDDLPHLRRWMDTLAARPGCQRGVVVPEPFEPDDVITYAKTILVT